MTKDRTAHSIRRHYRKLWRQAAHLRRAVCPDCAGRGYDFGGDACWRCSGTGKIETPAWGAFLLLRGAPLWLVHGEAGPPDAPDVGGPA